MPTRLRAFAILTLLVLGACGTIEAPVGLPFARTGADTAPVGILQLSSVRGPIAPVVSTKSIGDSAIAKKFDESVFARQNNSAESMNTLAAILRVPQPADRSDRTQRLTMSEVREFLDDYDADILRPFASNALRSESGSKSIMQTSKGVLLPTEYQVHKAYISAFLLGSYVDRSGQKHDAPEIKNGLSNEVLTKLTKLFFDARTDVQPDTKFFASKDGKFYPSGAGNTPTYITLVRSLAAAAKRPTDENLANLLDNRLIEVVADVELGETWPKEKMTVSKARMIGALATLAEKRSAIASGIAAELFGGFDLGFAVGGRFSVGDNKTAVELAKRIFASISYHKAERAALSYLQDNDFDPTSDFALFLNLLLAIDKQEAMDKEAAKPRT